MTNGPQNGVSDTPNFYCTFPAAESRKSRVGCLQALRLSGWNTKRVCIVPPNAKSLPETVSQTTLFYIKWNRICFVNTPCHAMSYSCHSYSWVSPLALSMGKALRSQWNVPMNTFWPHDIWPVTLTTKFPLGLDILPLDLSEKNLRRILGKSFWSSCVRFTFADLLTNTVLGPTLSIRALRPSLNIAHFLEAVESSVKN